MLKEVFLQMDLDIQIFKFVFYLFIIFAYQILSGNCTPLKLKGKSGTIKSIFDITSDSTSIPCQNYDINSIICRFICHCLMPLCNLN